MEVAAIGAGLVLAAMVVATAMSMSASTSQKSGKTSAPSLKDVIDGIKERFSNDEPSATQPCLPTAPAPAQPVVVQAAPEDPAVPKPKIKRQKQNEHIEGTPQHKNRVKQGGDPSTFDPEEDADGLTREAWEKGKPVPGRSGVRDHDFDRPVGKGGETKVRVHQDENGEIHGHPAGPRTRQ